MIDTRVIGRFVLKGEAGSSTNLGSASNSIRLSPCMLNLDARQLVAQARFLVYRFVLPSSFELYASLWSLSHVPVSRDGAAYHTRATGHQIMMTGTITHTKHARVQHGEALWLNMMNVYITSSIVGCILEMGECKYRSIVSARSNFCPVCGNPMQKAPRIFVQPTASLRHCPVYSLCRRFWHAWPDPPF